MIKASGKTNALQVRIDGIPIAAFAIRCHPAAPERVHRHTTSS